MKHWEYQWARQPVPLGGCAPDGCGAAALQLAPARWLWPYAHQIEVRATALCGSWRREQTAFCSRRLFRLQTLQTADSSDYKLGCTARMVWASPMSLASRQVVGDMAGRLVGAALLVDMLGVH